LGGGKEEFRKLVGYRSMCNLGRILDVLIGGRVEVGFAVKGGVGKKEI